MKTESNHWRAAKRAMLYSGIIALTGDVASYGANNWDPTRFTWLTSVALVLNIPGEFVTFPFQETLSHWPGNTAQCLVVFIDWLFYFALIYAILRVRDYYRDPEEA
jgi:hypothetical protein